MKSRIEVYLTDDEINRVKREAARQHISISRYAKERLAPTGQDENANDPGERLASSMRKMLNARADGLAETLRTIVVMLDQLVRLSTPNEKNYRAWQQTVEDMLRQPPAQQANGNGARV
jgi:hypothetical protein